MPDPQDNPEGDFTSHQMSPLPITFSETISMDTKTKTQDGLNSSLFGTRYVYHDVPIDSVGLDEVATGELKHLNGGFSGRCLHGRVFENQRVLLCGYWQCQEIATA